jgi:hypothetical protein
LGGGNPASVAGLVVGCLAGRAGEPPQGASRTGGLRPVEGRWDFERRLRAGNPVGVAAGATDDREAFSHLLMGGVRLKRSRPSS